MVQDEHPSEECWEMQCTLVMKRRKNEAHVGVFIVKFQTQLHRYCSYGLRLLLQLLSLWQVSFEALKLPNFMGFILGLQTLRDLKNKFDYLNCNDRHQMSK